MNFLTSMGFEMPPRPNKRREPLPNTLIFQLRMDLADARPPIWRRIEIRSDLNLWTLHRVIQGTFDWFDAHLYRFSLGGPYAWDSELFLCDFDVQDGLDKGTPVTDVRLDETLQEVGDQLEYLYDYGDNWHLKIKLEKVRPALPDDPIAVCTAGRRAAPPEDSGGITDPKYLAEFIEDPTSFDLAATNESIESWLETAAGFAPAIAASHLPEEDRTEHAMLLRFPQFRHVLDHSYDPQVRLEVTGRLEQLAASAEIADHDDPAESSRLESLSAVQSFLDSLGNGVKLTGAGYLPPKIAYHIGQELGLRGFELSTGGESNMIQVMRFRDALQHAGLIRKYKGDLLPTKAGKDGREELPLLWNHLVRRLLPRTTSELTFGHNAGLLTLLCAATSHGELNLELAATLMTDTGWRVNNGPVETHDVVFQGAWQAILLWYIAPKNERAWFSDMVSPAAAELARGALLQMRPASPM